MIKSFVQTEDSTLVELLQNAKHKFEDGDEVLFDGVKGMELVENQQQSEENKEVKSGSINETIWKVKVVNPYSFKIGDTRMYQPYVGNGLAKQLRTKLTLKFKTYEQCSNQVDLPLDPNLSISDFEKMTHSLLSHLAFEALDKYKIAQKGMKPPAWNKEACEQFVSIAKEIVNERKYDLDTAKWTDDNPELEFLQKFAFTSNGVFNPLCAFFGGFTA